MSFVASMYVYMYVSPHFNLGDRGIDHLCLYICSIFSAVNKLTDALSRVSGVLLKCNVGDRDIDLLFLDIVDSL